MTHCPQTTLCIILSYLAVINVVTFFLYGIDKWILRKTNEGGRSTGYELIDSAYAALGRFE